MHQSSVTIGERQHMTQFDGDKKGVLATNKTAESISHTLYRVIEIRMRLVLFYPRFDLQTNYFTTRYTSTPMRSEVSK